MELIIKNKQTTHTIIYDDDKHELLKRYNWRVNISEKGDFYANAGYHTIDGKRYYITMHRLLLDILGDLTVECDHQNGNGLDNRMCNLRIADSQKNKHNRKSWGKIHYKGVYVSKNKYIALIKPSKDERQIRIGKFDDVVDAAKAYDSAANYFFGEFAKLNFPDEVPFDYLEWKEAIAERKTNKRSVVVERRELVQKLIQEYGYIHCRLVASYMKENNIEFTKSIRHSFNQIFKELENAGSVKVENIEIGKNNFMKSYVKI